MADKLTQQIVEALSKAAAEPCGLPLFMLKSDAGLFASTAKAAAQKCLNDRLLHLVRTENRGKLPRELYAPTEAGWEFLLAAVNPKQVLEDFVRVLEDRQGEVSELLGTARQMAESLQGLKDAVSRVLPQVSVNRIEASFGREVPLSLGRSASRLNGSSTALLEAPCTTELSEMMLTRLAVWSSSANAGEDCPLPELFRSLSTFDPQPSLGEFHDSLRKLHSNGSIYLHPWTGPLYELPDPSCALLVGHGIAYYASCRPLAASR